MNISQFPPEWGIPQNLKEDVIEQNDFFLCWSSIWKLDETMYGHTEGKTNIKYARKVMS